ncbi:alpha-ketoglutarate-dependent dioxygenase AlkB family protein [Cognatilysobacter lacus]|uniref:Alpha-ketoglutarate-dependent dioxygenase AlkB n=1 Tax=Cognatilysobacter lacus TaxID=1643323 RepID=A0A5D8Z8E5_9GAMM|nr:alpha-ketoglutarate-dependent dioxygenase AlkB [Lysobacter lacus]TZF91178.1 alpha-ketoglutarate-dependent dioxygenase AlkB [Lysobacter lacus]
MLGRLDLPDADVRLQPAWLTAADAAMAFATLHRAIDWENHPVRLFGREHAAPRLSRWFGDAGTAYRYSGIVREPSPWLPPLAALRERLSAELDVEFNSVLANLYRDGRDAMGWHADDEPELGSDPVIASLSLGATRRFVVKHRDGTPRLAVELPAGSLLVMQGRTQANYRHALPRTARPVRPRINLTFRNVATRR